MASPSVASYFSSRKRAAADDLSNTKKKIIRLDGNSGVTESGPSDQHALLKAKLGVDDAINKPTIFANVLPSTKSKPIEKKTTRRTLKRQPSSDNASQPKIVKFTLAGTLSPRKKNADPKMVFQLKEKNPVGNATVPSINSNTVERSSGSETNLLASPSNAKRELSFDAIKSKVSRSSKLEELKAILKNRQQLEQQLQACVQKRCGKLIQKSTTEQESEGCTLKKFDSIELEVLSSPQKGLRTPTKNDSTGIMSPKKEMTPKRLFSPTKPQSPAYQRYQALAQPQQPTLILPYKYRCLSEIFRCTESICSMFYNRREIITFKKLKPAVQRMLRKNFTEKHLAQIKYLYPDAYHFEQRKMLNAGSHTKYDYYQLVICPNITSNMKMEFNVNEDKDNVVKNANNVIMNPHILISRQNKFNKILLDRVIEEHDKFLKQLDVPIIVAKDKIQRWHAEFDLESCLDILPADLPQPPNIEKFSSAKEILSTARNLFNCATPMERAMTRYEASGEAAKAQAESVANSMKEAETPAPDDPVSKALQSIPKSLLEKIRAKQAAKAYDAMTRRPSQDQEAWNYSHLPELVRHIRNIFVTENKGVLELDKVLTKLENSYRENLPRETYKQLLELLSKEAPKSWLTFHYIRKTDYVKINRNANVNELVKELEQKAQQKAQ